MHHHLDAFKDLAGLKRPNVSAALVGDYLLQSAPRVLKCLERV
jgi:hypothetical protein